MSTEFKGLTSSEARQRLQKYGPNTLPEERRHPLLDFLHKFWAPVPWMLEATIGLEIYLKRYILAWIIGALILFNAAVSFLEERKARTALRLLRSRLDIRARVLRDGVWTSLPSQEVVPGDAIRIRMGDIIPADSRLLQGFVSIDQSALTGESLPVEPKAGETIYAGSIVTHGEAYAEVTATGENTYFGKTAEILKTAKAPSHLEKIVFTIIKYLVSFVIVWVAIVFAYAYSKGMPMSDLLPFSVLLLIASIPVALPAMFALSTALGSIELAKSGILVTRLAAIEEAASMNILCVDKTGTITQNALKVASLHPYSPFTENDLLVLAAMACEESTQDPIDLAILKAAQGRKSPYSSAEKQQFIPFDPQRKCSEARIQYQNQNIQVCKGAPHEMALLFKIDDTYSKDLEVLSINGSRVLGVAIGRQGAFQLAGLIALFDPPRKDSKVGLREIQDLGVRPIMITGDSTLTASAIASQVGIEDKDVIAEVFPEGKFHIIHQLQSAGNICGMTGDGVNDAPALKRAEVGIAVSNATDVAKASASLVLTNPGLVDIIKAIKTSRQIYQRMLTYTLNKIIKTFEIAILLGVGLMLTGEFIISQTLIILILFANDFMSMSLSTDHVSYSPKPDKWNIGKLALTGGIIAIFMLILSFFLLYAGMELLHLSILQLQTWIFLTLIFADQAILYLVRERKAFWHSMPSKWLILSSVFDIVVVSAMALYGVLMAPIDAYLILILLGIILTYFVLLDFVKVRFFRFFRL